MENCLNFSAIIPINSVSQEEILDWNDVVIRDKMNSNFMLKNCIKF